MSYHEKSRKHDPIDRGNKGIDYVGTATFVGGRLASPFVQYAFLKYDLGRPFIETLRGSTLPQGPPIITNTILDRVGLSPYRSIVLAMSVGGMLKQNYHVTAMCQEKVSPALGIQFGLGNMLGDLVNTLLFVCEQTSASANGQNFPQMPLIAGSIMYLTGMFLELTSEQQRHNFKKDPKNKGKLYTGGLFSLSRHINLFGYTLWRAGYATATGGWTWGAINGLLMSLRATKQLLLPHEHYLEEKYGNQFGQYKAATPYAFVPWLY